MKYDIEIIINNLTNKGSMEVFNDKLVLSVNNIVREIYYKNIRSCLIEGELLKINLDDIDIYIKCDNINNICLFILSHQNLNSHKSKSKLLLIFLVVLAIVVVCIIININRNDNDSTNLVSCGEHSYFIDKAKYEYYNKHNFSFSRFSCKFKTYIRYTDSEDYEISIKCSSNNISPIVEEYKYRCLK